MNEEISDARLQTFYKMKLSEDQFAYASKILQSQQFCSVRLIKAPGYRPGVFVLANDQNQSKIWGVQRCKSPWSCPVCSGKRMAEASANIATAIDALNAQGLSAFMITFSLPHLKKYSCKQVYKALEQTWLRFVHNANGKKTGNNSDIFVRFTRDIQCKHRIRVGEFTYGNNGWHPHYHCLFFCPKSKLKDVAKWQDSLTKSWLHIAKMMTKRALQSEAPIYTKEEAEAEVERLYKNITEPTEGAFISKNSNGSAREAKSSMYVCGWGADKELTGNIRKKATAEGHYTPHQILELAYKAFHQDHNRFECDKYMKIYFEFALTVFKKYRMRLSPAINKAIKAWRKTEAYIETYKKKVIEQQKAAGRWRVVCWFKQQEWLQICHYMLVPEILELARAPNGKELITKLLLQYDIDISNHKTHRFENFVLRCFFNHDNKNESAIA